jgi:nitrite reductase (NO-forming)
VVLGGGPAAVRAATVSLERAWPARLAVTNAALLLCVLPVPSMVRVACSVLLLVMLLFFLVLLVLTVVQGMRNRRRAAQGDQPPAPAEVPARPHRVLGGLALGLAVVMLAVAGGGAADVRSLPILERSAATSADGGAVTPTGRTTTVAVTIRNMRFSPASVDVPAGNRLVINLHNTGTDTHDLVLETGARTDRLSPGQKGTLDAGVVGRDLEGWCSMVGHRQMGMVFAVNVTGAGADSAADSGGTTHDHSGAGTSEATKDTAAEAFDPMAEPAAGFTARDAQLPPATGGPGHQVHKRTITVKEVTREVDLRRHGPRARAARTRRRHLRDHPRQRRVDRPLGRLPRRIARAERADAHHQTRRIPDVPVHGHPQRHLDVPLLDHADVPAHRQRHVRRGDHRPARPAHGGP